AVPERPPPLAPGSSRRRRSRGTRDARTPGRPPLLGARARGHRQADGRDLPAALERARASVRAAARRVRARTLAQRTAAADPRGDREPRAAGVVGLVSAARAARRE